jgi:hypothetical protein
MILPPSFFLKLNVSPSNLPGGVLFAHLLMRRKWLETIIPVKKFSGSSGTADFGKAYESADRRVGSVIEMTNSHLSDWYRRKGESGKF